MSTVTINVKVVERTDLALLVSDGRKEAWVPLSQIDAAQKDTIAQGHTATLAHDLERMAA